MAPLAAMKPNPITGEFLFSESKCIGPRTSRCDFLASPLSAGAQVMIKDEPWCSFRLSNTSSSMSVAIYFNGETLESIHFSLVSSEFDSGSNDWSQEKEMTRKIANDKWLESNGLIPGNKYQWGEVWSGYDPKGGFSSVVIRYVKDS